jgi:hypothetical protein
VKVAVKFDGRVFVPQEPVDVTVGTEAVVEIREEPQTSWQQWLDSARPAPVIDLANLDRGDLYP